MRAVNPATKWLSVSRKDRGAILPMGRNRGDVYWYAGSGDFTSSRYYMDSLPGWVRAFNSRAIARSHAGKLWTLLMEPSAYPEPDSVGLEATPSGLGHSFPHPFPTDPAQAAAALPMFPESDELTLQFALEGVHALGLGASASRTDLLAVSLSATDAIGHRFGPDSRELHDQVLRLDRYLGTFLDSLGTLRGRGNVLVALTGDHGVAPFPTLKSTIDRNGEAKRVSLNQPWNAFVRRLDDLGIDTTAVVRDDGLVAVLKPEAFGSMARAEVLLADLARDFLRVQGVQRVDLMRDLARADTTRDFIARRWLHMFGPSSRIRLIVTLTPFSYWLPVTIATHGSPHDYDAAVPVAFWGAGVAAAQRRDSARVVDMAPTLAALLNVRPTERVDGRALPNIGR
jgi:predicted AlkP superfamily pyrophosphatase or phosphodiesterase